MQKIQIELPILEQDYILDVEYKVAIVDYIDEKKSHFKVNIISITHHDGKQEYQLDFLREHPWIQVPILKELKKFDTKYQRRYDFIEG